MSARPFLLAAFGALALAAAAAPAQAGGYDGYGPRGYAAPYHWRPYGGYYAPRWAPPVVYARPRWHRPHYAPPPVYYAPPGAYYGYR